MARQRQILVTVTYNDLGCIIDTKAEPYEEPNLQPTCNNLATDTISRQAAMNALTDENIIEHLDSVYDSELHRFKRATERIIAQLPPAQSEQRWIPCSEQLPEKSGQYYVSGGGKVWICKFLTIPNFAGGWCNNVSNPAVQAWTPLPAEPYKGES